MVKRIGLGKGKGQGYKNLTGKDSMIHSQSACGMKQPQQIQDILRKVGQLEQTDKQQLWVNIGFGGISGNRTSLDFKTEATVDIEQAKRLVCSVKSYNNYNGEKVAQALEKSKDIISSVEFGREKSPVLVIDMPFWSHQTMTSRDMKQSEAKKFSEKEMEENVKKVLSAFKSVGMTPDEVNVQKFQGVPTTMRLWWD